MNIDKNKLIPFLIPVLILLIFSYTQLLKYQHNGVLTTSVLSFLKTVAENNSPEPPDLAIEKVSYKKISDPTDDFNYYVYKSTIMVTNSGGDLINSRVVLHGGDNQKHTLIKNTEKGFTLKTDEKYIIRNYEFVFDGKYNGGEVPLELEVVDKLDYYKDNNFYTIDIFETPAKIENLSFEEILDDGTYVLDFYSVPFGVRKHDFELLISNTASIDTGDINYKEETFEENLFEYHIAENSEHILEQDFISRKGTEAEVKYLNFANNPFTEGKTYFVYLKATNPTNDYYAISDVLILRSPKTINRAQFAQLFVEYADLKISKQGDLFYEDVNSEDWYAPYVQTLFNEGLLNLDAKNYGPENDVTRADALRVVMDYYDVDLVIDYGAPHFEDVAEEDDIYPYAEALYASGKGEIFKQNLYPEKPATSSYLKYLINEFSKDN